MRRNGQLSSYTPLIFHSQRLMRRTVPLQRQYLQQQQQQTRSIVGAPASSSPRLESPRRSCRPSHIGCISATPCISIDLPPVRPHSALWHPPASHPPRRPRQYCIDFSSGKQCRCSNNENERERHVTDGSVDARLDSIYAVEARAETPVRAEQH